MKTWLTADWHLGDSRFELMGRPFNSVEQYIDTLIENHNRVVSPDDHVIVVGDVCYQQTPEFLPFVKKFNGIKTLLRGNHDRVFSDSDLNPYFEVIFPDGCGFYDTFGGVKCYVTHYPTCGREEVFNVVGHIHSSWKYQLNSINVGVDVHHFRPVDASRMQFHLDAISKYYDQDVWVGYNPINANYQGQRGKPGSYFKSIPTN